MRTNLQFGFKDPLKGIKYISPRPPRPCRSFSFFSTKIKDFRHIPSIFSTPEVIQGFQDFSVHSVRIFGTFRLCTKIFYFVQVFRYFSVLSSIFQSPYKIFSVPLLRQTECPKAQIGLRRVKGLYRLLAKGLHRPS